MFEMIIGEWTLIAVEVFVRPNEYEDITLNDFSGEEYKIRVQNQRA